MLRSNGGANYSQIRLVLFLVLSITMVLAISIRSYKSYIPTFRSLSRMGYRSRRTIPIRQCGLDGIRHRGGPCEFVGVEDGDVFGRVC